MASNNINLLSGDSEDEKSPMRPLRSALLQVPEENSHPQILDFSTSFNSLLSFNVTHSFTHPWKAISIWHTCPGVCVHSFVQNSYLSRAFFGGRLGCCSESSVWLHLGVDGIFPLLVFGLTPHLSLPMVKQKWQEQKWKLVCRAGSPTSTPTVYRDCEGPWGANEIHRLQQVPR